MNCGRKNIEHELRTPSRIAAAFRCRMVTVVSASEFYARKLPTLAILLPTLNPEMGHFGPSFPLAWVIGGPQVGFVPPITLHWVSQLPW